MNTSSSSHPPYALLCILVCLSLLMSGCGRPDSTVSQSPPTLVAVVLPQNTPLPIALTPTKAATLSPKPTHTAAPTPILSASAVESMIGEAVQRADAAQIYQMDYTLDQMHTMPASQPFAVQNSLSMSTNGTDRHLIVWERIKNSRDDGDEYMRVGDTVYNRDLSKTRSSNTGQWYKHPDADRGHDNLALEVVTMLNLITDAAPFGSLRDGGTITFDNQTCHQFVGEGEVALTALRALDMSYVIGRDDLEPEASKNIVLDLADVAVTICDDGYLHEYKINVAGQLPDKDKTVFTINFRLHLWDFDKPIVLTPPVGAIDQPAQR